MIVIDFETNGLLPYNGSKAIGLAWYIDDNNTGYIGFNHGLSPRKLLTPDEFNSMRWSTKQKTQAFTDLLYSLWVKDNNLGNSSIEDAHSLWNNNLDKVFMGHNIKFDLHVANSMGWKLPDKIIDTMVTLHTILSDWRGWYVDGKPASRALKWQAAFHNIPYALEGEKELEDYAVVLGDELWQYVNHPALLAYNFSKASRKHVVIDPKEDMWRFPVDKVKRYAQLDTYLTFELYKKLTPSLKGWGLEKLDSDMQEIQRWVALEAEMQGLNLDVAKAISMRDMYEEELKKLAEEYAPINLGSTQQVAKWLGLEKANKETLATLDEEDKRVKDLFRYRKLQKAKSTYLDSWLRYQTNGKCRSTFMIDGTVTGRTSSSGAAGNLQNIPTRGYTIKECVVPPKGYIIVGIDYVGLELHLASFIAEFLLGFGDQMLTKLVSGADLHQHTTDSVGIRDILYPNYTDEQLKELHGENFNKYLRYVGKTMNFGLLYGGGAGMLSKLLKIPKETAYPLVDGWRGLYPAFPRANKYYTNLALTWRRNPVSGNLFQWVQQPISGRYRRYDKYRERAYRKVIIDKKEIWEEWNPKEAEARKAFNNVVQGLGGYITNMSALKIKRELPHWLLFAQIHDALEFYVPKDSFEKDIPTVVQLMTDWETTPKLKVEVEVFEDNWHKASYVWKQK